MDGVNLGSRPVTRPNSFIFTLYGDLVHRGKGGGSLPPARSSR